jgi:UDP-glucose 4-epimerase
LGLSGGHQSNIPQDAYFEQGSILDEAKTQALFEKHTFDYVFHLAAYAAEGLSHFT